jgi:hypothetical protein
MGLWCKEGDNALIIRGKGAGRIVKVLAPAVVPVLLSRGITAAMWRVESLDGRPHEVRNVQWDPLAQCWVDHGPMWALVIVMADMRLRPLRDQPGRDEMLREAGAPPLGLTVDEPTTADVDGGSPF